MNEHSALHLPGSADTGAESLLSASDLGVRREGKWLIRNVDLAIGPGEIVSVVGPNGGGKTTLIKALVGIEPVSAGRVVRRRGLRLGYVPQRLAIDRTMPITVSRLMALTRRVSRDEMAGALGETGVAHLIDAAVQQLSGGEFQRVLIARALLGDPQLLVLDEPVQSVDFGGQVELYRLIAAVRERLGCAILLVSHDLHVVMRATDRVLCLSGHVCCTGFPEDVKRHPEYARLFGPRAAETLALYSHDHDHSHDVSGEVLHDHNTPALGEASEDR
jgi:zinc transport system ATP-binding protein